jgi:hypothetical protein
MESINFSRNFKRVSFTAVWAVALMASTASFAQVCPFDNGGSTLANDGLVLTRYALGIRGAPMLANTSFAVSDASTIESNIACPSCGLRVTDDRDALSNPIFTVADATIISRKLAGFSGDALTNGISSLGSGSRNTPAAVQSFLLAGCGATGGTVTDVTAGTGLTGGTITASGVIAANTAYLQRRVSSGCSAGSFITAIAEDGTPTCASGPSGEVGPPGRSAAAQVCLVPNNTAASVILCSDLTTGASTLIQTGIDTDGDGLPDDPNGITSAVLICGQGSREGSIANPFITVISPTGQPTLTRVTCASVSQ